MEYACPGGRARNVASGAGEPVVIWLIMAIRIVQVDAFTDRPFAGNPAAVCVLREARPEEWLRQVAREMNLSETAFLVPRNGGYNLRWLTPAVEVDLCGHATVASAHVLWEDGHLPPGAQAKFHTRSGLLTADRRGEWIELDFPAKTAAPAEPVGLFHFRSSRPITPRGQSFCRSWWTSSTISGFCDGSSTKRTRLARPRRSIRMEPIHSFQMPRSGTGTPGIAQVPSEIWNVAGGRSV
jgi:hypothetical protein